MGCQEVANMMGISRATVHRYCATGKFQCVRLNRKIFIRKKDVEALFDNAEPYKVMPVNRAPITEFYTMQEITEKFEVSESTVYNGNCKTNSQGAQLGKNNLQQKAYRPPFCPQAPRSAGCRMVHRGRDSGEIQHERLSGLLRHPGVRHSPQEEPRQDLLLEITYGSAPQNAPSRSEIKEWYSMNDIVTLYNFEPGYVSNLIYKNPIPKIRRGNKGYYSKEHFDRLVREKQLVPEYYTVEETIAKYNPTRDTLYHHIRYNNVPKIKDGHYIKISKPELDAIFEQPITI